MIGTTQTGISSTGQRSYEKELAEECAEGEDKQFNACAFQAIMFAIEKGKVQMTYNPFQDIPAVMGQYDTIIEDYQKAMQAEANAVHLTKAGAL